MPRPLDDKPRRLVLPLADSTPRLEGGFYVDTSGDQGAVVQVGLGVWAQNGQLRSEQTIRSCEKAGHGDPFIDGADCDGEKFYLKADGQIVEVLDEAGRRLHVLNPAESP